VVRAFREEAEGPMKGDLFEREELIVYLKAISSTLLRVTESKALVLETKALEQSSMCRMVIKELSNGSIMIHFSADEKADEEIERNCEKQIEKASEPVAINQNDKGLLN
jgi:hypothetical protein